MEQHGQEIHIDEEAARGGSTPHIVRYVLIVSMGLAIIALSTIWITGALTGPQTSGEAANPAPAAEMRG
ncbi:hypothetical protein [Novosphingobium album (ex Liu et al. 2023)]|uniref:Uncharacterized protein n=1 Tax=Novosphingobium album (ex Liu et al. 2023) TaxID=3031130 RepID=A0ABT5WJM4_9SPHN|nr:hypothetical protein [Novosphingobium album (ex Liu et al. 2023)]MDE8650241.1 hypothetical protein [Novosphingobium album (ex Liu et al. 2023)]